MWTALLTMMMTYLDGNVSLSALSSRTFLIAVLGQPCDPEGYDLPQNAPPPP